MPLRESYIHMLHKLIKKIESDNLVNADNKEFIAEVAEELAYEFNNILQTIKSNVELLAMSRGNEDNYDKLDLIYRAVEKGNIITKRLLSCKNKNLPNKDSQNYSEDNKDYFKKSNKEKILVIDDLKLIRRTIEFILTKFDYDVLLAENAEVGLEKFINNNINLTIIDYNMPTKDGMTLAEEILKINPKAKIIIMSGYEVLSKINDFKNLSIIGTLQKPFTTTSILRTIRNALDK
jgi:CheY-like chemotaxis protein